MLFSFVIVGNEKKKNRFSFIPYDMFGILYQISSEKKKLKNKKQLDATIDL